MSNTSKITGLVTAVSFDVWKREFKAYGRYSSFSDAGHRSLYEYLEDVSDDIGEPIEFDVIAIDCDYTEYSSLGEFYQDYDSEQYACIEDISNDTCLIIIDKTCHYTDYTPSEDDRSFIIQAF